MNIKYGDDIVLITYEYVSVIIARWSQCIVNELIMLNNAYRGESVGMVFLRRGSDNIILFQGVTGDRLAGGAAHLLHLFFFLPRPQHTM